MRIHALGFEGNSVLIHWQILGLAVGDVGNMYFLIEKIHHEFMLVCPFSIMRLCLTFYILYCIYFLIY